ncbi:MAG: acyl-homoserine-lactone synthase [Parvibaculum sp.]|uniref:acyl-homoserine-lactone synthase n=1 Tax=Parvibaculum sp. TaxID=2024848 RepID=UPI00284CA24E|nr:acyl-homoserine-lactone synthase [Parvibaculum sp.]MDR3499900.1 acyl-homoserine-lactone synthase [Parvibaculum sp.]
MSSIILIDDNNRHEHGDELDKMHALRHEVFVEQLKWPALKSVNGREYDQYDVPGAVYIVVKEGEDIAASVRLNWADKPTLLADVFPHLLQFETAPTGADTVDLSRFMVSPKYGSRDRMNRYGSDLICGILEYGASEGIANYTAVISTHFLSTILQWGVEAHAMGLPAGEGREEHVAVRVPATETSISHLYHFTRNYTPRLRTPRFTRWFNETAEMLRTAEMARQGSSRRRAAAE